MKAKETLKSPFDKEPAEGSRETVDKQLSEQQAASSRASERTSRSEQADQQRK
jgi:hypothetical protein